MCMYVRVGEGRRGLCLNVGINSAFVGVKVRVKGTGLFRGKGKG